MEQRVWTKIQPEPNSGCWLWDGACDGKGYGILLGPGRKGLLLAHRVVYQLIRGPIPNGLCLDHLCRVRCCVNPDHLEAVTLRENILRGEGPAKLRLYAQLKKDRPHCKRGHPYVGDNYRLGKEGDRICKVCERAWWKAYRAKRKALRP